MICFLENGTYSKTTPVTRVRNCMLYVFVFALVRNCHCLRSAWSNGSRLTSTCGARTLSLTGLICVVCCLSHSSVLIDHFEATKYIELLVSSTICLLDVRVASVVQSSWPVWSTSRAGAESARGQPSSGMPLAKRERR